MTDWQNEFIVTEEARESFEVAFNRERARADAAEQKLAAANALLRQVYLALPSGYREMVDAHLAGQSAALSRTVYEVWIGSEKTKERIIKETTDIEEAARIACADLSGCTFWGLKAPSRTEDERAVLDACSRARIVTNKAGPRFDYLSDERAIARAELARRGLK